MTVWHTLHKCHAHLQVGASLARTNRRVRCAVQAEEVTAGVERRAGDAWRSMQRMLAEKIKMQAIVDASAAKTRRLVAAHDKRMREADRREKALRESVKTLRAGLEVSEFGQGTMLDDVCPGGTWPVRAAVCRNDC